MEPKSAEESNSFSDPKGKGCGKAPGPPPVRSSKGCRVTTPVPKVPANSMQTKAIDMASLLQGQRENLRKVETAEMRYSRCGSAISEPMDQICMSDDPAYERAEQFRNALYLGGADGANMHDALVVRNIQFVISMIDDVMEVKNFDGITYWRSPPIHDNIKATAKLELMLDEVHALIDAELLKGHSVLVHCMMGISRSATVVTSYMMKKLKLDRDEALKLVRRSRSIANPNQGFFTMLKRFEQKCTSS